MPGRAGGDGAAGDPADARNTGGVAGGMERGNAGGARARAGCGAAGAGGFAGGCGWNGSGRTGALVAVARLGVEGVGPGLRRDDGRGRHVRGNAAGGRAGTVSGACPGGRECARDGRAAACRRCDGCWRRRDSVPRGESARAGAAAADCAAWRAPATPAPPRKGGWSLQSRRSRGAAFATAFVAKCFQKAAFADRASVRAFCYCIETNANCGGRGGRRSGRRGGRRRRRW